MGLLAFAAHVMSSRVMDDLSHMPWNIPSAFMKRFSGVSNSAIVPASMTHMRSYPIIVRNRSERRGQCQTRVGDWSRRHLRAMHKIVRSLNSVAIVS